MYAKTLLIYFLFLAPAVSSPTALGLNWTKKHEVMDPPTGYRYYMGSIDWGEVVYVGTEDLFGAEVEMQVFFVRKKISSALLILGPEGNKGSDCIKKYKKIVSTLSKKYGKPRVRKIRQDPLVEEMIYASSCVPVNQGMIVIEDYWYTDFFNIKSTLLGEDGAYYVEIEYVVESRKKESRDQQLKKVLQKL